MIIKYKVYNQDYSIVIKKKNFKYTFTRFKKVKFR